MIIFIICSIVHIRKSLFCILSSMLNNIVQISLSNFCENNYIIIVINIFYTIYKNYSELEYMHLLFNNIKEKRLTIKSRFHCVYVKIFIKIIISKNNMMNWQRTNRWVLRSKSIIKRNIIQFFTKILFAKINIMSSAIKCNEIYSIKLTKNLLIQSV